MAGAYKHAVETDTFSIGAQALARSRQRVAMASDPEDSECYKCLETAPKPMQPGCACRGEGACIHTGCCIEIAQSKIHSGSEKWSQCPKCNCVYTGPMGNKLAEALYEKVRDLDKTDVLRIDVMSYRAHCRRKDGWLAEAEEEQRAVLDAYKQVYGAEHPTTLAAILQLVDILYERLDYYACVQLLRDMLETQTKTLGAEHADTLRTQGAFARLGSRRGADEKQTHEKVYEFFKKTFGPDHADTVEAGRNYGTTLYKLGESEEAGEVLCALLNGQKSWLGHEHPETLETMVLLSHALSKQGKYTEAKNMLEFVLKVRTRTLGSEHPQTLRTMFVIGLCLNRAGEIDQAEMSLRKTAEAYQNVFVRDKIMSQVPAEALADGLMRRGKYAEAEKMLKEIAAVLMQERGAEHYFTLKVIRLLGICFYYQRQHPAAQGCFKTVLETRSKLLGTEYDGVQSDMRYLAKSLLEQRQYAKAVIIMEKIVSFSEQAYGATALPTLLRKHDLAACLSHVKEFPRSLQLFRTVASAREEALGAEHADTMSAKYDLVHNLIHVKTYSEAEGLARELIETYTRLYASEHLPRMKMCDALATCLINRGDDEEAAQVLSEQLAIRKRTQGHTHKDTEKTTEVLIQCFSRMGKKQDVLLLMCNQFKDVLVEFGAHSPEYERVAKRFVKLMNLPEDTAASTQKRPVTDAETTNERAKTGRHPPTDGGGLFLPEDTAASTQKRPATDAETANKRAKTGPDRQ